MPRSSQEAIERRNAERRAERAAKRKPAVFKIAVRKGSPEYRRTLPKFPEMSKAELRAVITRAFENTVTHGQV